MDHHANNGHLFRFIIPISSRVDKIESMESVASAMLPYTSIPNFRIMGGTRGRAILLLLLGFVRVAPRCNTYSSQFNTVVTIVRESGDYRHQRREIWFDRFSEFSHNKLMPKSSPWSQGRKATFGRKTYNVLSKLEENGNNST